MNSAKLKALNVLQDNAVIMAGLREALAVIEKQNLTIAGLQHDVSFLEKEYYSAKSLLEEHRRLARRKASDAKRESARYGKIKDAGEFKTEGELYWGSDVRRVMDILRRKD